MRKIHGLEALVVTRLLVLIGFSLATSLAHAQSTFASFEWKRDSRFELQFYYNGTATSIKGNLLENSEVQVVDNGFTLDLKAFPEGFLYAVVTHEFDDVGFVFLIELQNGFHVGMHSHAIPGRKSTILNDMKGILESLKRMNGWDVAIAMRSMVEYFETRSGAQLSGFYDAVEAGQINTIPRPRIPTTAVENGVVQLPDEPTRPPRLDIEDANAPSELDVLIESVLATPEPVGPVEGPGNQQFQPIDMTQGWDGDEPAAPAPGRQTTQPQPVDLDDDVF